MHGLQNNGKVKLLTHQIWAGPTLPLEAIQEEG
jgi:hypothetical protein